MLSGYSKFVCTLTYKLVGFHVSTRNASTAYVLRTPPPSAPREVPTPLVFVSASSWDPKSQTGMRTLASMFSEQGYTCLEVDLAHPEKATTSDALMHHFESDLVSHIRLTAIPFPPVIIARASGALIAQTYISSHPASGLLLVSPPPSNKAVSDFSPSLLPTPLAEFDFEPKFPCAIVCAEREKEWLKENRLWKDGGVDKLIVKDKSEIGGQEVFVRIGQWLDDIGV
ncbi:hypothetical protein AcW1_009766 [Taiwanofungus camphoratus]|nr:hypothetical protein AcV7_002439 [Antrodia cinnamomea]KAI0948183.1 hypothetical protein AcW1_009766 [Antrodia cinnamomea]